MALQPWLRGHNASRCSVLTGGGSQRGSGSSPGGGEVEKQQQVWYGSAGQDQHVRVSQTGAAAWQAERARSCSLCSKITSPGCAFLPKLQLVTASTGETANIGGENQSRLNQRPHSPSEKSRSPHGLPAGAPKHQNSFPEED